MPSNRVGSAITSHRTSAPTSRPCRYAPGPAVRAAPTPRRIPGIGRHRRLRMLLLPDDGRASWQRPRRWAAHPRREYLPLAAVQPGGGLRPDFEEVTAGLTREWTWGDVEGNVNRLPSPLPARGQHGPDVPRRVHLRRIPAHSMTVGVRPLHHFRIIVVLEMFRVVAY